jgi:hypothetical protein
MLPGVEIDGEGGVGVVGEGIGVVDDEAPGDTRVSYFNCWHWFGSSVRMLAAPPVSGEESQ